MKITINQPCHENWDSMKPNDKGAFCLSCQKNVIDFSSKTITQIKDFFNELPLANNVCGRFKEKQLKEMSLDHFLNEFMNWQFFKKAAVIFYFVFGITLLSSCSSNTNNDKVGKMQVMPDSAQTVQKLKDSLTEEVMLLGEPAIIQGQVKSDEKCADDKNNISNTKSKHLMGGPSVKRDTAEINKKSKRIAETLVKELNPKETKKETVNEIAPGK